MLHGMGGDSSAANNPVYGACNVCYAHSTCDSLLHLNCTLSKPLILHVRLTLSVPFMLIVTHFIYMSCILYVPYMLHIPVILHVPHEELVPCALCLSLCCMFISCCVCPVSLFQLIPMIRHFKSDLSLPLALTVSLFPFTKARTFVHLRIHLSNFSKWEEVIKESIQH